MADQHNEQELIRRVAERLGHAAPAVVIGIGDDAAVVRLEGRQILTTDLLIEGVHFDLRHGGIADAGYKALMVSLSDINAMGGRSTLALGQLGVPPGASSDDVDELLEGIADALAYAEQHGQQVRLIGGDTVAAPQWIIGFTVLGEPAADPLLRSGARPGDRVYHSGLLGAASAGLFSLHGALTRYAPPHPALAARLLRPRPPLSLGPHLAERRLATAAQDLSDSLSQVAMQLAAASGVGLRLDFSGYQFDPAFEQFTATLRQPDDSYVVPAELNPAGAELRYGSLAAFLLSCAEDYELLVTAPTGAASGQDWPVEVQQLGEVVPASEGLRLRDERGEWHELRPTGFSHFG